MKYLGTLGLIFIYRLQLQICQPNSGTKSIYSTWIALPKPLVTEKSVASFMDQREYDFPSSSHLDFLLLHRNPHTVKWHQWSIYYELIENQHKLPILFLVSSRIDHEFKSLLIC